MELHRSFHSKFTTILSSILTLWMLSNSSVAKDTSVTNDPPCYFNPLCTCSKAVPDLGIVTCRDTELYRIPQTINNSKVFMLQLHNVGLETIEPHFLQSTGLYKISITKNPLYIISDDAFIGLERTLWRLDLNSNELLQVPTRSLRFLQKLRWLDLSGNEITGVSSDSWNGFDKSLETLVLADNSITHLPPDAFTGLPLLETINLKGNNLREIDPSVFHENMARLAHIILSDNQLRSIPYLALSPLKNLKTLDLSYNRVNKMNPTVESGTINIHLDVRMNLDLLHLEYNQISILETGAFQYFNILNKTYLDGNIITSLENNAFQHAKIKELYMRYCGLQQVTPEIFESLSNSLEVLDLTGNNITNFHGDFLSSFNTLRSLYLGDNVIGDLSSLETASNGVLNKLDVSGLKNGPFVTQNFKSLKNLRALHLSRLKQSSLSSDDFLDFGVGLEELYINFAELKTVKNSAFQFIHGLKILDLSENQIGQIESNAFADLAHSLMTLRLSHSLLSSTHAFPSEPLKMLTKLKELDVSNNRIKNIPENGFHFLSNLRVIELQDNEIQQLPKGTFQGDIHGDLEIIYLSFNNLKLIERHAFSGLPALEQLHLDDNHIEALESNAFWSLENLRRLNLKGNKISTISFETFQNLPELEDLDLSFNQLISFHFSAFDQVGILSNFRVNISHNRLGELSQTEVAGASDVFHSNIKILDLSYNNISEISAKYFSPIELSLTHLYLSHNHMLNATRDVFGNMPHIQWLDLSYNKILDFDVDTFRNTRNLQVLLLSHNYIAEIPRDFFRGLYNLRVVDLANNRIRFLPENLFKNEGLERFDLSNNQLTRFPESSISFAAASTLCLLDLSGNAISTFNHVEIFSKLERLVWLDLSKNRLVEIDFSVSNLLPKTETLDLSHNTHLSLQRHGKAFLGIEDTLLFLKLDNLSLTLVPDLHLNNLVSLSLAYNSLTSIPPDFSANLSSLRSLNLEHNYLTKIPIVTHSLNSLRHLSMAANPISVLTNTSLLGVASHLERLDITDLPLTTFETGALNKMHYLHKLKISTYSSVRNFNIPNIIECNFGLRSIEIEVENDTDLKQEMVGKFPEKLRNIVVSGTALKQMHADILNGVTSPFLHFSLHNTSVSKVSSQFFDDLFRLRNLSLDIDGNSQLQSFANPSRGAKPGSSSEIFLLDVTMRGNHWTCDCDLGWIEIWQRTRRQYLCSFSPVHLSSYFHPSYTCRHVADDIRNSACVNKGNQSLVEVLKTEIECGWSSDSASTTITLISIMLSILLSALL